MPGKIDIIILDKKDPGACGAGCGMDWSVPENIALARERIEARFNREVDLAYHDVTGGIPARRQDFQDRLFPVLLINGHVRVSGQFDMRMLLEAVDTELEISRVR